MQFQNKEGQLDYVWQTSWGVSTRLIGGLIMTHSDDKGLVLPPKVAPQKAVLVPIYRKDEERAQVLEVAAPHREGPRREAGRSRGTESRREVLPLGAARRARRARARAARRGRRQDRAEAPRHRREGGRRAGRDRRAVCPPRSTRCRPGLYAAAKERLKANTVLANSIDEVECILRDATAEKGGGKFVMAHMKDDPAATRG